MAKSKGKAGRAERNSTAKKRKAAKYHRTKKHAKSKMALPAEAGSGQAAQVSVLGPAPTRGHHPLHLTPCALPQLHNTIGGGVAKTKKQKAKEAKAKRRAQRRIDKVGVRMHQQLGHVQLLAARGSAVAVAEQTAVLPDVWLALV
jgi:hypothetical protein